MRALLLGMLLVWVLPASALAGEPESCGFRVVNWNAAGLDPKHGNNEQPIKVGDAVIKYVEEIDANVITLQEVMAETVSYLEMQLGWDCHHDLFGRDYLAVCVDGAATNLDSKDLPPDPNKPDPDPPEFPWWGYVQVEYQGVLITSVHTRSFWRNHHRAELHADVQSGIIAGDFNHIDAADPGWFQTDLDREWTWEGEYRGTVGQWKIDHILTVEEPQHVSGDARDKEGSNHRVVVGEVSFPETPSIAAAIANVQQPIEVDGSCMVTAEFQISIHDNCCLDPNTLALDVTASNPTANATLGPVSIDSVISLGPRDVEVTGHVVLSALESCPAEIVIDASVQDCFGNAADTVSQGTSASVLALDTTPPEVAASDSDLACLWPPNHRYVCLDAGDFDPVIADNCAANPTWEFAACSSDQPDNALGDGNTIDDCVLDADGQGFCARSERAGRIADGRRYDLDIRATDSCGNVSTSTEIGNVYVPRARSQALMCLAPAVP